MNVDAVPVASTAAALLAVAVACWSIWHNDTADQFKELKQIISANATQQHADLETASARQHADLQALRTDLDGFRKETNTRLEGLDSKISALESNQNVILQRLDDARIRVNRAK